MSCMDDEKKSGFTLAQVYKDEQDSAVESPARSGLEMMMESYHDADADDYDPFIDHLRDNILNTLERRRDDLSVLITQRTIHGECCYFLQHELSHLEIKASAYTDIYKIYFHLKMMNRAGCFSAEVPDSFQEHLLEMKVAIKDKHQSLGIMIKKRDEAHEDSSYLKSVQKKLDMALDAYSKMEEIYTRFKNWDARPQHS